MLQQGYVYLGHYARLAYHISMLRELGSLGQSPNLAYNLESEHHNEHV